MGLSYSRKRKLQVNDRGSDLRTRGTQNECIDPIPLEERWYTRLHKWIITIDGDVDIPHGRGYRSMPMVMNYVFFLGGRLRTVRHTRHLSVLIGSMIVVPMVLFSIFEANLLWNTKYGYKVLVFFFYYFWGMAFSFFIKTATSDPGILPRNIHLSHLTNPNQIPQEYFSIIHLPTSKTDTDPKSTIQLKYCSSCKIWRPPRASHCSTCCACIEVHDHHCIWVNNCVGKRNYRYFIIFLTSLILTAIFLIANTAIQISRKPGHASEMPVTILLLVYGSVFIWYPISLLIGHVAMTGTQQTTREFLKRVESSNPVCAKISPNENNPYDKGSFLRNMAGLMLQTRGLSTFSPQERNEPGDWRFEKLPEVRGFEKIVPTNTTFP